MRRLLPCAALALLFACPAHAEDQDLAAFANGGLIEHVSAEYGGSWTGIFTLDENVNTGWASPKDAKGPFEIVISLPEKSEIHAVAFDTEHVDGANRNAKAVDVSISDTSATDGFKPLASVTLKQADGQRFPASGTGRWIKLVVKSNGGDADYSEIMGFHAYGKPLTNTPLQNVSGTYSSAQFGDFHLMQTGAQLSGCYEHDGGLVQGGLEAHLMRLTWTQNNGKTGPAIMVQARDGKSFKGFWADAGNADWHPDWDLKKISDKVGSCPHWNVKQNVVADDLASAGRVRLYGINFDSDSDHLRADAKPAVDQLLDALKKNAGWKVTIEGHTDSTSTAAHNLDLSKRRAEAVKAALVAGGIDAARLSTQGFGQTKPVAPNTTEIGRAQNRRVEIAKQ
ncbi:MAG TPA: OmpA family protein [Rhizomicrobium sp.]|nr:OmpA family protein [Rhizomicrobium sp.]